MPRLVVHPFDTWKFSVVFVYSSGPGSATACCMQHTTPTNDLMLVDDIRFKLVSQVKTYELTVSMFRATSAYSASVQSFAPVESYMGNPPFFQ